MPREVVVDRYLSRERNVLAARAAFGPLFADYLEHSRRWVGEPDGLVGVMMRQGLASAALYLTCRPRDEETAWTINFPEPPLNIFITASAAQGHVAGRYFDTNVKSTDHNRLFVQTASRSRKPHLSVIEVSGFDVLQILDQYYRQSEQATTRFIEGAADEYLMIMALPGIDEAWLQSLPREEARRFPEWPGMHLIEQRPVSFSCRCNSEQIVTIVEGIFRDRADELFGADISVEVQCPRCGQAYRITREEFERHAAQRQRPPEERHDA